MTDDLPTVWQAEPHTIRFDLAEAVLGIRRGLESIERGEGIPAEEAFAKLRKKYNIPQDA